jgi:hypothetical protein
MFSLYTHSTSRSIALLSSSFLLFAFLLLLAHHFTYCYTFCMSLRLFLYNTIFFVDLVAEPKADVMFDL